jgi:hypothetical protein
MTTHANWVREALKLFRADCTRTKYAPQTETFVVSPANSRGVLGNFMKMAKNELLIYDPKISDKEMLHILQECTHAGVKIKVIGSVAGSAPFEVQQIAGIRLHTRTIIRDRSRAFVGSQSLRTAELDARREVGLIIQDAKLVGKLVDTFETDWAASRKKSPPPLSKAAEAPKVEAATVSAKEAEKAVQVLTEGLDPLTVSVKKAVRLAVAKAGDDVLHDKDVKDTMKNVVKKAVKEAVKEAVQDAQDAREARDANAVKSIAN